MRVLIVGLGSIAQKHIHSIKKIDHNTEFYALRSSASSAVVEGVVSLYRIDEIGKYKFDFAIISNPTSEHQKTIEELLNFEIPLFIEKPLYHTVEIESTVTKLLKRGVYTYVACNLRFLDSIKFIKKELELKNRRVNEVNSYCGSYLPSWRKGVDYKENYSSIPELGGGVHIDLIHEIDYLFWLFGEPMDVRKTFRNSSTLNIRSVDYANYLLIYDYFCANVVLNYFRPDSKRQLEIVFEDETWTVDLLQNRITSSLGHLIFESEQSIADTYYCQMRNFLQNVSEHVTFNDINEAYKVLKICLDDDFKR